MAASPGHDPPDKGPPGNTGGSPLATTRPGHSTAGGAAGEGPAAVPPGEAQPFDKEAATSEPVEENRNTPNTSERQDSKSSFLHETWGDKVRARRPLSAVITEDVARGSNMLQGIWNPIHVKQLMQTLMTNWEAAEPNDLHDDLKTMRTEALAPAKASCDESIRAWTDRENLIFVAYLNGELELPHPPNFIKEVLISEHRAMIEDMHEANFNYTLTAVLSASVRLASNAPHAVIFRELFVANTDNRTGHDMMRALQNDVKRLSYDGLHTLRFTFYSKRAAARWLLKALRFQKAVIVLQDTTRRGVDEGTGHYNAAQLELQYAIRIYGGGSLGLVALARAFTQFSEAKVLDVEYARASQTEIYDNRYHTIRFAQATCPLSLRGVTRIVLDGTVINIHHFQQNLRRPCVRCLNPRHGTKRCTIAPAKVETMRARATRIFNGAVTSIKPASWIDFRLNSLAEVVEMLTTKQQPHPPHSPLLPVEVPLIPGIKVLNVAPKSDHAAGTTGSATSRSTSGREQPDADGFYTKTTKHKKDGQRSDPKSAQGGDTSNPNLLVAAASDGANLPPLKTSTTTGLKKTPNAAAKVGNTATGSRKHKARGSSVDKSKSIGKAARRFEIFQRTQALGRYEALVDSDSDEEDDNMAEDDDAPYAFTDDAVNSSTTDSPMPEVAGMAVFTDTSAMLRAAEKEDVNMEASTLTEDKEWPNDAVQTDKSRNLIDSSGSISAEQGTSMLNSSKHSKRKKQHESKVGLQQGALKGMQTSMTNYILREKEAGEVAVTEGSPKSMLPSVPEHSVSQEDFVPFNTDSHEEITVGKPHMRREADDNDLPIQLGHWLNSFNGTEVAVAANGQCAFLALYASTTNHAAPRLQSSASNMLHATELKRSVYSLMMNNLRRDVEVGQIDPIQECSNLFPKRPPHTTQAAATAALYSHYNEARERSVDEQVPPSCWAGPNELRAMAQFLREPILVFDANQSNDAHVQRYAYKTFRRPNGTDHESGYVEALPDRTARDYLEACWHLHVLPTFLVLRHHDHHFSGVSHGETFLKWRAEGDAKFASGISDMYHWKESINNMTPTEASVDLRATNQLANTPEINGLMHKRLEMRDRLDLVHARLGLPILDHTDVKIDWSTALSLEEIYIHTAYGIDDYAANSQRDNGEDSSVAALPLRQARPATGALVANTYFRILRGPLDKPLDDVDVPLDDLVSAANEKAFAQWCSLYREELNIPPTKRRNSKPSNIREWLLTNPLALRHFFAFLPYPEKEAKRWPLACLLRWGAFEAYNEQVAALRRIAADANVPTSTQNYCLTWIAESTDTSIHHLTAEARARSSERWKQLQQWISADMCRLKPTELSEQEWFILHVIPYIIGDWAATPMGRTPNGARATWYKKFDFMRTLCLNIIAHNDWSAATLAPAGGHAWYEHCAAVGSDLQSENRK